MAVNLAKITNELNLGRSWAPRLKNSYVRMMFSETLTLQCFRVAPLSVVVSKKSHEMLWIVLVENHSENVKTAGIQWVNVLSATSWVLSATVLVALTIRKYMLSIKLQNKGCQFGILIFFSLSKVMIYWVTVLA